MFKVLALLLAFNHQAQSWDPDAGYVKSWTNYPSVTVSASSSSSQAINVIDNDDNTQWNSGSCLPSGYVNRRDENILLGLCASGHCSGTTASDADKMTDGDQSYTVAHVNVRTDSSGQPVAKAIISLQNPTYLALMSTWGVYKADTRLDLHYANQTIESVKVLNPTDNYKQVTLSKAYDGVIKISLTSSQSFLIKEVSSIGAEGCREHITVDLGLARGIGVVRTRHWAGTNTAAKLVMMFSTDNTTWVHPVNLIPDALHGVTTNLSPVLSSRFIRLSYTLVQKNYNKVYCWEIDAWGLNHVWGQPIVDKPQNLKMRDIIGVNGIWGWQHNKHSDNLKPGEGPQLYNVVASHARNYHNLEWDVTDPSKDPQYEKMANGHGTQSKSWVNWDREYRAWRNANLTIDVSWQFTNKMVPQSHWSNPELEAYNLGRHFATHFGSEHGVGLIDAVEVGNEPWDYEAGFYNKILRGMSAGLRGADSKIKILPGAFQAHDKDHTGNYIGTRVTQDLAQNISVVNFHTYSFMVNDNGKRVANYPEHPNSEFNSIRNIVRWRDVNMAGKPIWVTEWGWDADGKGEGCTFPECVSEKAQALYGIRGLLILTRSNVQKVTWFFYANSQYCNTLFCRSGLTASIAQNFTKKDVFVAFQELLGVIGDKYFLGVYMENVTGYIYMYGDSTIDPASSLTPQQIMQRASHLVAWKPVSASDTTTSTVRIALPRNGYSLSAKKFTGESPAMIDHPIQSTVTLELSTHPIVVDLHSTNVNTGQVVG